MCQWLVFVVFMGRWSLAVCGTGVAAVRVTADEDLAKGDDL